MFQVVIYYHSVSELLNTIVAMPRGKKKCNNCSTLNYAFNIAKQCTSYGFIFGKKDGRPSNTKASDGYYVGTSGGRPSGTKASDGYSVGTSGGS